jgi:glycosyltransferase involved in cell wall biosynthesis
VSNDFEKKELNICLISPMPPPYGGIAHWTSMVNAYAMDRDDIKISIVNTAPRWRSLHKVGFWLRVVGGGLQLIRDALRLTNVLRTKQFDAIHLVTSGHLAAVRDVVLTQIAGWFAVPIVLHIRFGRIPDIAIAETLEWRLLRSVMRCAAAVIAIDRKTFEAIEQYVPEGNYFLIPNCVNLSDLPLPKPLSVETKRALFVGWVLPAKGVSELCEAWSKVKPNGWTLEIVGPVEDSYKAQLQAQSPSDSIEFTGLLPHAQTMDRMANCDLFLLPSYTEGFPNAVVEAMALGRPIVATTVGAIPEMLDGEAGILIERRNADQLATAIRLLTGDRELSSQLGLRAGKRASANYSIDVVFDAYMSCWRQISKLSNTNAGRS